MINKLYCSEECASQYRRCENCGNFYLFLGPPGAGKGTMAFKAKEHYSIPHISTGDLFRAAIEDQTELGKQVKSILDKGDLVPDELTTAMIKERLKNPDSKKGFILDGFPRTIPQAEALKEIIKIDKVVNFTIPESEVVRRLSGRRVCRNCGESFHMEFIPPKKEGVCDKCSGELYTRDDDQIDAIKNRLSVYNKSTAPLINFYKEDESLVNVNSNQKPDAVFNDLKEILK
ncbi:MAG: adenylate kinase [Spirochaetaceae bacterium 4572_59]|nr:MAG: adenylate kinase [Spirochaetaceae bacterium 4572_59]